MKSCCKSIAIVLASSLVVAELVLRLKGSSIASIMDCGDCNISNSADKESIKEIIGEYIMENPTKIVASLEKYQHDLEKEKYDEYLTNVSRVLKEKHDKLYSDDAITLGNGKHKTVKFMDYFCGYCRNAHSVVQELLAEKSDDIKVFIRPVAILGETSKSLAKAATAIYMIDKNKLGIAHDKFFAYKEFKDSEKVEDYIKRIVRELDIDQEKFHELFTSDVVQKSIDDNLELLKDTVGYGGAPVGVPVFIIGSKMLPGYVNKNNLLDSLMADSE